MVIYKMLFTSRVISFSLALLAITGKSSSEEALPNPCDSSIYCHGDLLHTIQMAELYSDSKSFVDMSLVNSPNQTLKNFRDLIDRREKAPTKEEIETFVNTNFKPPGSEFIPWEPEDWQENPNFLNQIEDPALQSWANDLHNLWKKLGRKISTDVKNNPEKYSQIHVPNPVIVPGGRFREFYYWDSYWTMEGLLLSNMTSTVKGMLQNFVEMVKRYGMVPNGGRIYFTRRSQPPYLIPMFKLYFDYTQDFDFLRENLEILEKEFMFWENNRRTPFRDHRNKVHHRLFHYNVQVGGPRPESYKEDFLLANDLTTDEEKEKLYVELKSGAESGWDYSTRWFIVDDNKIGERANLNVTTIAPVDLNSQLCYNAKILSDFYNLIGNESKSKHYEEIVSGLNQTIAEVFWDETDGIWYDVNINTGKKRRFFYLSNMHPLFGGCYGMEKNQAHTLDRVINYLKSKEVLNFIGGVPTSLKKSGEQWDFPNAWAPLQHIAIMGLYNGRCLSNDAEELAFELAEKWVRTNYEAYRMTDPHAMFEKYDVTVVGVKGGGGEYPVQLGFGWSNGVAMKFLDMYGDRLTATEGGTERTYLTPTLMLTSLVGLLLNNAFVH